jgi:hypothetical protein
LGYLLNFTPLEQHIVRAGALFHDIGNIVDRSRHHIISQESVEKLTVLGRLPFTPKEAELIGLVCRWHRGDYDPYQVDTLRGENVRTGLLAAVLRIADAMDIDRRRSDYDQKFRSVLEFFFPAQSPYWTSLEEILGVRVRSSRVVSLQVLTDGQIGDNIQIHMLRKDLASTPLGWSVEECAVEVPLPPEPISRNKALLVFPFEAHSLVMAALSRKQLRAAGCTVECLCYPDTVDAPAWLWRETLPQISPAEFAHLVAIGDRPDAQITDHVLRVVRRWHNAKVTILNRHEANWGRLPRLMEAGATVVVGGDWAYYWGERISKPEFAWTQIASLIVRDPTMAQLRISSQDQALVRGLLYCIYKAMEQSASDTEGWFALAEPILDHIAMDDRDYFIRHSDDFIEHYAAPIVSPRLEGRVLIFHQTPARVAAANYWAMEAAIEQRGRTPEREIRFNTPYVIATWSTEGGQVELLAINHWRDEGAIPIRLLYPTEISSAPHGHESTVRALLSKEQSKAVVEALIAACNR